MKQHEYKTMIKNIDIAIEKIKDIENEVSDQAFSAYPPFELIFKDETLSTYKDIMYQVAEWLKQQDYLEFFIKEQMNLTGEYFHTKIRKDGKWINPSNNHINRVYFHYLIENSDIPIHLADTLSGGRYKYFIKKESLLNLYSAQNMQEQFEFIINERLMELPYETLLDLTKDSIINKKPISVEQVEEKQKILKKQ